MISSWYSDAKIASRLSRFAENPYIGGGGNTHLNADRVTMQVFMAFQQAQSGKFHRGDADQLPKLSVQRNTITETAELLRGMEAGHFNFEKKRAILYRDLFVIPPSSGFLQSRLDRSTVDAIRTSLTNAGHGKTDVIVMDPPWPSKSAARRGLYSSLSVDEILENLVSLDGIIEWNGLVAVWVTNNDGIINFVLSRLFPALGLTPICQWAWVKVTSQFEPVIPFSNPARKCYERVLVGIKNDFEYHFDVNRIDRFLFTEVCLDLHSLKPSLDMFLDELLVSKPLRPIRVELFARNVKPGYLAWGDQALLLQHPTFYQVS